MGNVRCFLVNIGLLDFLQQSARTASRPSKGHFLFYCTLGQRNRNMAIWFYLFVPTMEIAMCKSLVQSLFRFQRHFAQMLLRIGLASAVDDSSSLNFCISVIGVLFLLIFAMIAFSRLRHQGSNVKSAASLPRV